MTNTNPNTPQNPPEIIPTITPNQYVGWFFEPDDLLGWKMTPGQKSWFVKPGIRTWLELNQDGVRGQEFPKEKGQNDRFVLLLADSFGVAIEVEEPETFASQLQQKLAQHSANRDGKDVLINASVGGFSTEQEYIYLKEIGPTMKPDIVLVAFHFGSDVIENCIPLRDKIHWRFVKLPRPIMEPQTDGSLKLANYPPDHNEVRDGWRHYYDFLPTELREIRLAQINDPMWSNDPLTDRMRRLFHKIREAIYKRWQRYFLRTIVPVDALIYSNKPNEDFQKSWGHTARILAGMKDECEKLGAQLVVASVVTKEQIIPGFLESRIPKGARDRDTFDGLYPSRRLGEILGEIDVPYIDLTDAFIQEQHAGTVLYHEADLHWNATGHALAAEVIWQHLREILK